MSPAEHVNYVRRGARGQTASLGSFSHLHGGPKARHPPMRPLGKLSLNNLKRVPGQPRVPALQVNLFYMEMRAHQKRMVMDDCRSQTEVSGELCFEFLRSSQCALARAAVYLPDIYRARVLGLTSHS